MPTNKDVRKFLNKVAKLQFNKKYPSLSAKRQAIVRKKGLMIMNLKIKTVKRK